MTSRRDPCKNATLIMEMCLDDVQFDWERDAYKLMGKNGSGQVTQLIIIQRLQSTCTYKTTNFQMSNGGKWIKTRDNRGRKEKGVNRRAIRS